MGRHKIHRETTEPDAEATETEATEAPGVKVQMLSDTPPGRKLSNYRNGQIVTVTHAEYEANRDIMRVWPT